MPSRDQKTQYDSDSVSLIFLVPWIVTIHLKGVAFSSVATGVIAVFDIVRLAVHLKGVAFGSVLLLHVLLDLVHPIA